MAMCDKMLLIMSENNVISNSDNRTIIHCVYIINDIDGVIICVCVVLLFLLSM